MTRALRTGMTLVALVAIVVAGGMWGWGAFTKPFPQRSGPPPCTQATLAAGDSLTPEKVIVSVYNASDRSGLASRTANDLDAAGFPIDTYADAPSGISVKVAEVWVDDPKGPVGRLVRSYLGKRARIRKNEPLGLGVTLVVGPKFRNVVEGKKSLKLSSDTKVCLPPSDS